MTKNTVYPSVVCLSSAKCLLNLGCYGPYASIPSSLSAFGWRHKTVLVVTWCLSLPAADVKSIWQ